MQFGGTIGFVGCGQMARALGQGFLAAQSIAANRIVAYDPFAEAGEAFAGLLPGATLATSNEQVVGTADLVVLAVKPQVAAEAMSEMKPAINSAKIVVSIVAGLSLESLCQGLGTNRVVRVMPNTPCLVQQGALGFSAGSGATADDCQTIHDLLAAVGVVVRVSESQLDAVTGLSGSGPAFVFTVIEALSDGGVRMGLSREVAMQLAAQTVLGSASLVLQSGEHPGVLKDRVTSPGGTTIAGIEALEAGGIRAALIAAVRAATERSLELSEEP